MPLPRPMPTDERAPRWTRTQIQARPGMLLTHVGSQPHVIHVSTRDNIRPQDLTPCVFPSSCTQGCVLSHTQTAPIYPLIHAFIPHAVGSATRPSWTPSGAVLGRWKPGQSLLPVAPWGTWPLSPEASSPSFLCPQPLGGHLGPLRSPCKPQ